MKPLEVVLVGAGHRGRATFGAYALAHPDRLKIVALAEPREAARVATAREHEVAPSMTFSDWRQLLEQPRLAEAAIVATSDKEHVEPALAAIGAGYHLLLEKPIAPSPEDCVRVVDAAEAAGRMLQIGHVLRYTAFYQKVQEIASSGRLGRVHAIDMKEHVAHWHMTHSYVRGKFRNEEIAAPILLAKCCHDLDLLTWIAGEPASHVASFGSRRHYCEENAPEGAPNRCHEGCPVQTSCPHDAVAFYLGPNDQVAALWPWFDVSSDPSHEARRHALETGRYGRCVFRCDNDVNDHQVLIARFGSGITATFTVHGLATNEERTIRISGSRGELRGIFQSGLLELTTHGQLGSERVEVPSSADGHFGGDEGLLDHFTEVMRADAPALVRTSGRVSLESHLLGFAAEEARRRDQVVEMAKYRASVGAVEA